MALITATILPQTFETIRSQIAAVLATELANQKTLNTAEADFIPSVCWEEHFSSYDKEELPAVNVSYSDGALDGHNHTQSNHTAIYHIDVYMRAKADGAGKGDAKAMTRLQRLLGICRAILMAPQYVTLGLSAPIIFYRHDTAIQIRQPDPARDTENVVMGRLTLEVKMPEVTALQDGVNAAGVNTTARLYDTGKGYYWEEPPSV